MCLYANLSNMYMQLVTLHNLYIQNLVHLRGARRDVGGNKYGGDTKESVFRLLLSVGPI